MLESTTLGVWVAKLAGAVGGSIMSVAYFLPKTKRDAGRRFFFGFGAGVLFGGPASSQLEKYGVYAGGELEQILFGSAAVSLFAWVLTGVVAGRIEEKLNDASNRNN